jgi:hypothetical protein
MHNSAITAALMHEDRLGIRVSGFGFDTKPEIPEWQA